MNKLCTIYIIRHGETEWNAKEIIQGQLDSPLTKEGIEQIHKLKIFFKRKEINSVYSSDLGRAIVTAEILASAKKLEVIQRKNLRERFFGIFQGKKIKDIKKELKEIKIGLNLKKYRIEGEEALFRRFEKELRRISRENLGKTVLVVTHGQVIRNFLFYTNHLSKKDLEKFTHHSIKNLAIVKLKSNGAEFFIKKITGITV